MLTLLVAAGCTAPEHFSNAPVDRNGSFYIQCSPHTAADAWRDYASDIIITNTPGLDSKRSGAEQKIKYVLLTKLLLNYSGVDHIKELKASSTHSPDGRFINKAAVLLENKKQNGISFFGENCDLRKEISNLPDDCSFAVALSLDIQNLVKSMDQIKFPFKEKALLIVSRILDDSPDEWSKNHSGTWIYAIRKLKDQYHHIIIIPDREKKLYDRIAKNAIDPKKEILDIRNREFDFHAAARNGKLLLSQNRESIAKIIAPAKTLADLPDFNKSAENISSNAVYWSWQNAENESAVFALSRTSYGFFGCGNDKYDWNSGVFKTAPFKLLDFLIKFTDWGKESPAPVKKTRPAAAVDKLHSCRSRMAYLAVKLKEYKKIHGSYPDGLHIKGLTQLEKACKIKPELFACTSSKVTPQLPLNSKDTGFVYFGNWGKNASEKLPLLTDRPDNHNGAFCVVFNDGSVKILTFKNQKSVKRIASFMHTVYKYCEEDFTALIKRAEQLDNLLDKE